MRLALLAGCLGGSLLPAIVGDVIAADAPAVPGSLSHSATWETSRTQETRLRDAKNQIQAGRIGEAIVSLQKVLDEEPAFVSRGEGLEHSHAAANRLLESLPATGLRQYEEQFGNTARAKFRIARRSVDWDRLRTIAHQYRLTQAGWDALRFATLWHFDHADYLPAAAGFQALSEHPLSKNRNTLAPGDAARWMIALSRAGLPNEATRVAKRYHLEKFAQTRRLPADEGQKVSLTNLPSTKALWKKRFALPGPADKRLQAIRQDLEHRGLLPVSSGTPLVVGKLVIARTFEEILACDRETGEVKWRKPLESQTVELAQNEGLMANPEFRRMLTRQLASAAFADRNAGTITSDGSRVFVVLNDHGHDQILNVPGWDLNRSQMDYWSNWGLSCCQLLALDAATGTELWRRPAELPHRDPARPKFSGRIRDPLPEVFFFGPPRPLGNSLYAIGQKEREIRLFVLSPETGKTEWSLPLVATELPLMKDRPRRRLALPVVCQNGLLLCPTGAGALAAVDLHSRSCRWIFRYPRNDIPKLSPGAIPAGNPNTHASLDRWWTGWRDVGLIVDGETVLLASPESSHLHAVSLKTGDPRWSISRDDGLFLAEGTSGQVLLVGSQSIRVLDAQTGKQVQEIPTPTPAGRGMATTSPKGKVYLLPLKGGGVWEVDLTRKTSRRTFPSQELTAGNLIVDGNSVVVQSSDSLQRLALLNPETQPPKTAEERLAWAKTQREAGRFREAVNGLKPLHSESKTEELTKELRETLLLEITAHPERAADLAVELEPFLQSAEDRIRGWQTIARAEQQVGHSVSSLQAWLKVMAQNPTSTLIHPDDPALEISHSRFLQGAILDLLQTAVGDTKSQLEASLETHRTQTLNRRDPFAVSRYARRFDQLKWGQELIVGDQHRTGIGQTALEQQLELWAIAETATDPALQAMALRRMAEDRLSELRHRDAAFFYRRLAQDFPKETFPDRQSVAEFLQALPEGSPVQNILQGEDRGPNAPPKVTKQERKKSQSGLYPIAVESQPGSLCKELDIWMDLKGERLRFVGAGQRGFWELRLPKDKNSRLATYGLSFRGWGVGPLLIFRFGTDLLGIAPLDDHGEPRARVLWRVQMLDTRAADDTPSDVFTFQGQQPPPGFGVPYAELLDAFHQSTARVGPVTAGMLVYQSGGRLIAIDPATGRTLWSRSQLPMEAKATGDGSHIVVVHRNHARVTVLRSLDGQVLAKRDVPPSTQLLTWWDSRALLQEDSQTGVTFQLWDAVTGRILWQHDAPAKTMAFAVDSERWGFITPTGKLTLADTESGRVISTTHLDAVQNSNQVYAVVDDRRIILGISHDKPNQTQPEKSPILDHRVEDLPSQPNPLFTGSLHGLDRRTGKPLWHSAWGHWTLSLAQPATGPVLVLHHWENRGPDNKVSVLRCLDKRTGKELITVSSLDLYETPRWEGQANPNEFEIQAFQNTIRLQYEEEK